METLSQRIEGAHVGFLRQVTCKQEMRRSDGYWRQVLAEEVLQEAEIQTLRTYVARRPETVAELVPNRDIFMHMCERRGTKEGGDSRCRGGGRR